MTAAKSKTPIESFGPELMAALVEGGRRRIVIKFEKGDGVGKRFAHTFQRRVHMLRQRMREEQHPDYIVAARARLSLVWGKRAVEQGAPGHWKEDSKGRLGAWIIISPQDSEFKDILAESGVTSLGVTQAMNAPPRPAREAKSDYDDLMDELEQVQQGVDE